MTIFNRFRTGSRALCPRIAESAVLVGEQAVQEGIIDEVGGLHEALDRLHRMIDEKQTQGRP